MSARGGRKSLHTTAYSHLLELLREERERAAVSQEALSARLDRARTYITKCEAGERRVDLLEWLEIMAALDADPVAFLHRLAAAGVLRHPLKVGRRGKRAHQSGPIMTVSERVKPQKEGAGKTTTDVPDPLPGVNR